MARKRPRLPTFSYNDFYRYFLTFCTHERRRVFVDNDLVALVWEQIVNAADVHAFAVLAYVFIPDHVHLLVEGQT